MSESAQQERIISTVIAIIKEAGFGIGRNNYGLNNVYGIEFQKYNSEFGLIAISEFGNIALLYYRQTPNDRLTISDIKSITISELKEWLNEISKHTTGNRSDKSCM